MLIVVATLGVMMAMLRVRSPHSVLVMLACACGLLSWAAATAFLNNGTTRRLLGTGAICGFGYLAFYVFTDTVVEAWINAMAVALFAVMNSAKTTGVSAAEFNQLSTSTEFQYFHQKIHLALSVVVACVAGWIANS